MPINPSIPLGVQPFQLPQRDPNSGLNALAKMMQLDASMQESEVNRLKIDEYKRGIEDKTALRNALSAPDADPYKVLLGRGMVKEANDFQTGQANTAKAKAETDSKALDMAHKRMESWGQAMGFVRQNPTPENATAAVQHLITLGVMPQEMAQKALAGVQADPQSIAQWATQGYQAALQAKDQLPKYDTRNLGGSTQMTATDPVTGQVRIVNNVQNTQSPDAQLQAQTSEANNRRSVGAQYDLNKATRDAAAMNAQATRDAASIKDKRDTEMKLADDYRAQSKGFKEVSDAYRTIETALDKATTSPAATLAGATKFMKLLDPGSVVRESELGMALAATGVFDRAQNYANSLRLGKVLTAQQAADFKNIAGQIYQAAQKQQQAIDANYKNQAQQYGLRPENIMQDLGQNGAIGGGKGPAPGTVQEGYRFKGGNPADQKNWEKM